MLPESLPIGVDALNVDWLTHVLWEAGALTLGNVIAFRTETLPSHHAHLLRLRLEYDTDGTLPHTLIAKFSANDPTLRNFGQEQDDDGREITYYQRIAQRSRLRSPICYYAARDPHTGNSALLLEDLAPARGVTGACSYAEAALAVQEIAKLHGHWWRNARLDTMDWLPGLDQAHYQQLQQEMNGAWVSFLAKVSKKAPQVLKLADTLRQQTPSLARLCQEPQTVIHYDFVPENVLYAAHAGETPFAVVDWDAVRKGCGPLDVASFLGAGLTPAQRRKDERDLLQLYYAALLEGWVARYSFEECWRDYRLAMLDCLARAIVIVGALPDHPTHTQRFLHYATAALDLHADEFLG